MTQANQVRAELYYSLFGEQVNRLLCLLDRDESSASYGSFDRSYWLHRTSDYSSAANQMGVQSLAHIWNDPRSEMYHCDALLKWIVAAIEFTLKIQHKDGSYDEWYPNERGWAGPTAYVLLALTTSYKLTVNQLPPRLIEKMKKSFKLSISHLEKYEENDVLANHQALACAAIVDAKSILNGGEKTADESPCWKRFLASLNLEGWSLEYDGADPGYQTATLSFLARLHRITNDQTIKEIIQSQLDFLKYFFYPNGEFGGVVGSRDTSNIFVYGFEYWSRHFPLAAKLAEKSAKALELSLIPAPKDQEDHYLIYRLGEFYEAYLEAKNCDTPRNNIIQTLPYEETNIEKSFFDAGILIRSCSDFYTVFQWKKGATILVFSKKTNSLVFVSTGIHLQINKRKWSSSRICNHNKLMRSDSYIETSGNFFQISAPLFRPASHLVFRTILSLVGAHAIPARLFKKWIRKQLMTGKAKVRIEYTRELKFRGNEIDVIDSITNLPKFKKIAIWYNGVSYNRLVPQSRYPQLADRLSSNCTELEPNSTNTHTQSIKVKA